MMHYPVLKQKDNGFTLIEMIVTVVILGVLAAVAVPNLLGMYNRQRANAAIEQVEGAIKEAQRLAVRNGRSCAININNGTRTISGGCLLSNRVFGDYVTLNSDQAAITFSSKGTTLTPATIRVTANNGNVDRCLVLTNGVGLIRTGDYDTDNNACVTRT